MTDLMDNYGRCSNAPQHASIAYGISDRTASGPCA